jgi:hypothetical protein
MGDAKINLTKLELVKQGLVNAKNMRKTLDSPVKVPCSKGR